MTAPTCYRCDGTDGYHNIGCPTNHAAPYSLRTHIQVLPYKPEPAKPEPPRRVLEPVAGKTGMFRAASESRPGRSYIVLVAEGAVLCNCPGYTNRHACWHATEAQRLTEQARIRDLSEQRRHAS